MTENAGCTFSFRPAAIAVHYNGYVLRQIIEVYIFLKRSHKAAKIAFFSNFFITYCYRKHQPHVGFMWMLKKCK
jgi:hypothetical protein